MDWMTIGAWVLGGGGLASGLWNWLASRRTNDAQAKQTEEQANVTSAAYAAEIIKQADERVAQYKADAENARADRDKWQEECRGQRKAKQEWRGKHEESVARIHELELSLKDRAAENMRLEFDKCLVPHCKNRRPPRREPEVLTNVNTEKI